jgi:pilus assembly protein CpaB
MLLLAAVALALAIGVSYVTYRILSARLEAPEDSVTIVVAARNIPLGTRLKESDLRTATWPRAVPIEGSFERISDVVDRGALVSMVANEPILGSKLAPAGAGSGLPSAIPEGMRAVSVKVNDVIGVAGFVLPGSRVDVILSGSPTRNFGVEMSKVILENIQVLAADQNVTTDDNGKPQSVQVVTLAVTPEDSQKLALASAEGKIQLALRNPLDLDRANPSAVRREGLYGAAAAPAAPRPAAPVRSSENPVAVKAPPAPPPAPAVAPAPPPPPKVELQLIHGTKSERVVFEEKPQGPAGDRR